MKGFVLFAAAVIALVMLSAGLASTVYADTASDLDLVLVSQSPYPAEPGSTLDIEVELQNNGLADATNVELEISPSEPFSLLPGQQASKSFSRITADSSVKTSYKLSVSQDAISSDYDLSFRIYTDPLRIDYVEKKLTLTVRGNPKLVLQDVTTEPDEIEPGGTAVINVAIRNVGSGNARNLEAILNSNSSDIIPVLSRGRIYMGTLEAGQTKQAQFEVSISTEAEHRTYPMTVTLDYEDETNAQRTESFSIGIPVTGSIVMHVVSVEPDYERGTLDVEIANKGTGDATSLEAKLVVNGEVAGTDYVSTLKATKKTTLSFPLVNGYSELVLEYMKPDLQKVVEKKELGKLSFQSGSSDGTATVLGAALFLIIAYFGYRRFFRKRKK